jgi:hypothetical protein
LKLPQAEIVGIANVTSPSCRNPKVIAETAGGAGKHL